MTPVHLGFPKGLLERFLGISRLYRRATDEKKSRLWESSCNLWCDSQHDTVKLHVASRDVKSAFRYCDVLVQLGTIKAW